LEPHLPVDPLSDGAPSAAIRDAARVGLYVHVPFCARRCSYCDFSSDELRVPAVERWAAALEREIARRAPSAAGTEFSSLFFGGGTPSAIAPAVFTRVMRALRAAFRLAPDAEVTLEANPESVRPERLDAWAAGGVRRLSMGAQSFEPGELATLGRIHPAARPAEAFALARAHGFTHLSLDLMFGFPGHTDAHWAATLERALALAPEHLSAYCFIPEAGTALGDATLTGRAPLPAPEEQAERYAAFVASAARAGLARYETSNAARPGAESRHNLTYWLRRPYLGLGPSAHGLWEGTRYANHHATERWAESLERGEPCEAEREAETDASVADEALLLGLRLDCGLQPGDHPAAARAALRARHGRALEEAVACGRLERAGEGWRVPPALAFVADEAIAWVAARAAAGFDSPEPCSVTSRPCPSPPSPVA
jgi:oxygen-independent coproporphyrinogen III oxidase